MKTLDVITIPLDTAGVQEIHQACNVIHLIRVEGIDGVQDLDGMIEVAPQPDSDDFIPMFADQKVRGYTDRFMVRWAAQSGKRALLFVAREFDIETPPTKQIVTTSTGNQFTNDQTDVGTSAVLIAAANTTRQSLTVYNNGAGTIYLGGSGVTVAGGLPVPASTPYIMDGSTAALYAISASGTNDVRTMEEHS